VQERDSSIATRSVRRRVAMIARAQATQFGTKPVERKAGWGRQSKARPLFGSHVRSREPLWARTPPGEVGLD
jgi:hypothetical protein